MIIESNIFLSIQRRSYFIFHKLIIKLISQVFCINSQHRLRFNFRSFKTSLLNLLLLWAHWNKIYSHTPANRWINLRLFGYWMVQIILKNKFEFILLLRWKSLLIRFFSFKYNLPRGKLTKIATCSRTYSVLNICFCLVFPNFSIILILKFGNRRRTLFFRLLNFFLIIWCLCHGIKIYLIQIIWYLSFRLNNLRRYESWNILLL